MRLEHTCKSCGAVQVANLTVTTLKPTVKTYDAATTQQDDTLAIIVNWLAGQEQIRSAVTLGLSALIGTFAWNLYQGRPVAINLGVSAVTFCLALTPGALLPTARDVIREVVRAYLKETMSDFVVVESLEKVSDKQARLISRAIELPTNRIGLPLFREGDLLGFARVVVDEPESVSFATGLAYGVKRTAFKKIRDWAIEQGYLIWYNEDVPSQGIFVLKSGQKYFKSLLSPPPQ